jgi:hypothetical protein
LRKSAGLIRGILPRAAKKMKIAPPGPLSPIEAPSEKAFNTIALRLFMIEYYSGTSAQ